MKGEISNSHVLSGDSLGFVRTAVQLEGASVPGIAGKAAHLVSKFGMSF